MTENNMNETPEERGERIGEAVEEASVAAAVAAATPAGRKADGKKHVGIIVAVVAFAVVLIGAGVAYSALAPAADEVTQPASTSAAPSTSAEGTDADKGNGETTTPAPDFTVKTAEGNTIDFSSLKGKPILLNFWASWCGPCKSEMPELQNAYEQYGEDVQFVMVNTDDTEHEANALISSEGYTFPVYFDVDNSAAAAYGVTSIPQTYLIDEEGNIVGGYMGSLDGNTLLQGINMLLTTR